MQRVVFRAMWRKVEAMEAQGVEFNFPPAARPQGLTKDEAISLMSIAVDFDITQVVDGNWGVHAIIKKSLFAGVA
jgi:acetamidase/formamidase